MNPVSFRKLFSLTLAITASLFARADGLPSLKPSQDIVSGTFGNGIRYYIAKNTTEKGMVDIALVQNAGRMDESPSTKAETIVFSRESLTDLPRFGVRKPMDFLLDNNILPSEDGYVTVGEDATVYNFRNIDIPLKPTALDSTLLLVFDIIGKGSGPDGGLYSSADKAIIIAGDVNPSALVGKMDMLSMLVPGNRTSVKQPKEADGAGNLFLPPPARGMAEFSVTFGAPRIARSDMATVLPLVSGKYAGEFGSIIKDRIRAALTLKGIPVAGIRYSHVGSGMTSGQEKYTISVCTSEEWISDATAVLAETLAIFDMNGATEAEYTTAQDGFLRKTKSQAALSTPSNASLVRQCTSAFLYGASLADIKAEADFFKGRNMDAATAVRFFNNFAKSLIDIRLNTSFSVAASPAMAHALPKVFHGAWTAASTERGKTDLRAADPKDAVLRRSLQKTKVKIDNTEPLSGGRMWTFANGIKVIFKKTQNTGDVFHYAWLLKGGYSSIKDLKPGEGGCVSDMLWCNSFNGISGDGLRIMLENNGVEIKPVVTLSDFRIQGTAPEDQLELLMKSLLLIANDRVQDNGAFTRYRKTMEIVTALEEGDLRWRKAVLDSIMTPGSSNSIYKRPASITDDFRKKTVKYYSGQFAKMNDGVLIIVGGFDEESLKKQLSQCLGGFKVEKVATYRASTSYITVSGRKTVYSDGDAPSLDISFSTPSNYTADNLLASSIAAEHLRNAVAASAAKDGWTLSAESDFEMFPQERFCVNMYLRPADDSGLPGTVLAEPSTEEVLTHIHKVVKEMSVRGMEASSLDGSKKSLSNRVDSWASDPPSIIDMLILRYSYGKDLMTDQAAKVNAITLDRVNTILRGLCRGSIAEYAVSYKKKVREPVALEPVPLFIGNPPVPEWTDIFAEEEVLFVPEPDVTGILESLRPAVPAAPASAKETAVEEVAEAETVLSEASTETEAGTVSDEAEEVKEN